MSTHGNTSDGSGSDGAIWSFNAYLDANPGTREVLLQRVHMFPEYESWLRQFGETVRTALDIGEH